MTSRCDSNPHVDKAPGCFTWDFSEKTFLLVFLLFLGSVVFSWTTNGFLFFLSVRHKQRLWQPQYFLITNISACGLAMSSVTALLTLSSLVCKQTQTYGRWCIAQFCLLRCFFLTFQMTLALLAVERYIFICHGIHYLRVITSSSIQLSVGLVWLVSAAVSVHGGLLLSRFTCSFGQQTNGLLCDAFNIKGHISFSPEDNIWMLGPPSVITVLCILAICYCYGCMYQAALRVSMALKCSNHRANTTVGFYFLMFFLQLAPNVSFIILTMTEKSSSCRVITSLVSPTLITIPPGVNAAFTLLRNPEIKRLLFAVCRSPVTEDAAVFQQSSPSAGDEERPRRAEQQSHGEREASHFHLPGYVSEGP